MNLIILFNTSINGVSYIAHKITMCPWSNFPDSPFELRNINVSNYSMFGAPMIPPLLSSMQSFNQSQSYICTQKVMCK